MTYPARANKTVLLRLLTLHREDPYLQFSQATEKAGAVRTRALTLTPTPPHLAVGVERTRGLASERTTLGKLAEATEFECLVVCGLRSGDDLGAGEEWADGDVEGDIGWYRFGNTAGRFISDPGH